MILPGKHLQRIGQYGSVVTDNCENTGSPPCCMSLPAPFVNCCDSSCARDVQQQQWLGNTQPPGNVCCHLPVFIDKRFLFDLTYHQKPLSFPPCSSFPAGRKENLVNPDKRIQVWESTDLSFFVFKSHNTQRNMTFCNFLCCVKVPVNTGPTYFI